MAADAPADRCSFALHARFAAFDRELRAAPLAARAQPLAPTTRAPPRSPAHRSPRFETLARAEPKLDRQAAAARQNAGAARSPFREPAAHRFREPSPARWRHGRDFVAKFALPSRQDLRRRTALAQQGFFGPARGEDAPPHASRAFRDQLQARQPSPPPPTGRSGSPRPRSSSSPRPRSSGGGAPAAFHAPLRPATDPLARWPPA